MEFVEVNIQGMTCGHCEQSVTEELQKLNGVTEVVADHTTGKADVSMTEFVPELDIRNAVSEAGYEVTSITVH